MPIMRHAILAAIIGAIAVTFMSFTADRRAYAASSINPSAPASGSPMTSAPVRNNFVAAANDVNGIESMFAGTSPPGAPTIGQDWLFNSGVPLVWYKYDGSMFDEIGTINQTTHKFSPLVNTLQGNPIAPTAPSPGNYYSWNGTNWVPVPGPLVINVTALRGACTGTSGCPSGDPVYPNGVTRMTDGVANAPPMAFAVGSATCATDDGATCVNSADGKSWVGKFPGVAADPRQFGAIGDGVTNDNAIWQNIVNDLPSGATVELGPRQYCITGITINSALTIRGGGQRIDLPQGSGFVNCSPNLAQMITVSNEGAHLENFSILAGTDGSPATSGSVLLLSGSQIVVSGLAIRDACNAVTVTGQRDSVIYSVITGFVANSCTLAQMGTSATASIDPRFQNNSISSKDIGTPGSSNTVAFLLANDGGGYFDHNDILFADTCTSINPQAGENVSGVYFDSTVLGDTCPSYGLYVNTGASSASIYEIFFHDVWASSEGNLTAGYGTGGYIASPGIYVRNGGGGKVSGLNFLGHHEFTNGGNGIDIDGTYSNVLLDEGQNCANSYASPGSLYGILVGNTNAGGIILRNNTIGGVCGNRSQTIAAGLYFSANAGAGTITRVTGNTFVETSSGGAANYVGGTEPTGSTIGPTVFANNDNLDTTNFPVASATTIDPLFYSWISLTGSTNVSTISGPYSGRTLSITDTGGASLVTGGNILAVPASFAANQLIICKANASSWFCH